MIRLLLFTLSACLVACAGNNQEKDSTPAVTVDSLAPSNAAPADSASWVGMYKGVTPCEGCAGIETTLTLNADSTYTLKLVYNGTDNKAPLEAAGRFRMTPGTNTVVLDGLLNLPNQYSVGQNMLIQLDMTGQPITGLDAAKYMLMKQQVQTVTIMKQ